MADRIRRVRTAIPETKKGPTVAQTKVMQENLKSIAQWQREAEQLRKNMAEAEADLFADMIRFDVIHLNGADGDCWADITQSAGKATNLIDPKGLRGLLKNDADYYACVSVSVTKTKEFLSGKELESITTHIPGKVGDKKLKITKDDEK